ncbi:MAG: cbb3-type cytochrome c oxidase subunit I [Rickettsiales bacterium]
MLELVLPQEKLQKQVFILWFILAVVALAFSGIYSFLPYALRTPGLSELLDLKKLFSISLMVHVNLGVLVWFLSSSAMLMTIVTKKNFVPSSLIAFLCAMTGTIFIIVSPFIGASEAVKSDYVPILHNLVFIFGISIFISGILLQVILTVFSFKQVKENIVNFTIYMSSVIFLIAVVCFIQAAFELRTIVKTRFIDLIEYYELLFWGAGHVLQFNYIQLIIIVWIIVIGKLCPSIKLCFSTWRNLQIINYVLIIPAVFIYWFYPVDSLQLNEFFTFHMRYFGGLLASLIATWSCYCLYTNRKVWIIKLEFIAFCASIFLILTGGVIGYLITGANVTIPAHYHGVILGITVGLMELFYMLLPQMGFKQVNSKLAMWQIILYSVGQFIHILALAISGGYGVLRKTPGTEFTLKAKMFMAAMGVGGTIALAGGILFVVLIFTSMRATKNEQ